MAGGQKTTTHGGKLFLFWLRVIHLSAVHNRMCSTTPSLPKLCIETSYHVGDNSPRLIFASPFQGSMFFRGGTVPRCALRQAQGRLYGAYAIVPPNSRHPHSATARREDKSK
jgi:hypothetical protein